jgi:hypothetical protein
MGFMLMLVLACSLPTLAQSGMSSDSSMKKSDKMMGKKKSMTGCISEKEGKYMLMDKDHPNGVALMSSEDLKPHVGHKVKVIGTMEKMNAMSGDSMSKDNSMKHDDMGMMTMKISDMKMISDQCEMSSMSK